VVDCKYGSQRRGWCSNQTRAPYGVSLWKYIRAGWESFAKHITFKMGDGSRIKFWKDSWCGDQPLQTRFPELFRLACDPNATVDTHLVFIMPHMFGILSSIGLSRIGNWKWGSLSWSSSILFPFVGVLWILCGGSHPTKGSLRYTPITLFWFSLQTLTSLRKGCGIQKCHPGWPFSYGWRRWVGSLPLIIYRDKG
jgi:hypothetical protein